MWLVSVPFFMFIILVIARYVKKKKDGPTPHQRRMTFYIVKGDDDASL